MKSIEFIKQNPEIIKKAKNCNSLNEFLNLAKQNNVVFEDLSLEEAYSLLNNEQELKDDVLDNVAGGKKKSTPPGYPTETYPESVGLTKKDLQVEAYYVSE